MYLCTCGVLLVLLRSSSVVARCGQTAATSPVSARHLGEEDSHANSNRPASVSVPPSAGHIVDTEIGLKKLLDWERLQQTIYDISSLSDLSNGVESAALYGVLQDKLQRLRERLADGFQGSHSSASAILPVQQILCKEQPNASGCSGEISSGMHDTLVRQASSASFTERVADRAASDGLLKIPYDGLVTPLPVQIQEQIQKNLEIEQVILEHKLLLQQLALNKQIEEFRRDIAFEEWLDFWNQLGPQVYDQPVPEDTADDTEASELLERLASRYPQLFEDQAFAPLPIQKPPSTISQTKPLSTEVVTQTEGFRGSQEDRRSKLGSPVTAQTHQEPSPPALHSTEYSDAQRPSVPVKYSESRQGVPDTLAKKLIVTPSTDISAVNQAHNIKRSAQGPATRPEAGSPRGQFEPQPPSSAPFHPTPVHTSGTIQDISIKVRAPTEGKNMKMLFDSQLGWFWQELLQSVGWVATSLAQVAFPTLPARWLFGGPLQAMEYTDKKIPPAPLMSSLRGGLPGSRAATDEHLADDRLDQKSLMMPPAGAGTVGLLDNSIFGRHYTSSSEERENNDRQESSKTGPLLNLFKALRDVLAVN
ncbi:conserved hypothetical protein [Neospora caninum Liverpool]|uniref:Uncharacterized protein n=1 Tax=Neospora caninum (strain Liverpool) TaxID=572307 RepID=F0VJP9_NEOCL|nr:conserved hypothetical protein [Neospora caninum Liverpool]CBZ53960.1 conserved hypothetical protein [Neospora caninum Liverpool]CEL67961.1 TPA: hypothetical protein BN1204_037420 [Neospora caninum Liverpool]|eukprot:XP_003883992.1 conserved hypothetical protein [Neospora caninum Liverpool]